MKHMKSSVVIARLLNSEGFTDYTANQIEKYWKKSVMKQTSAKKIAKLDKEFSELAKEKLNMKERLLLGRFITLHKRMSFDTGLRIGITAFAQKTNKVVEDVDNVVEEL